jgi:hypothetical protein
MTECSTKLLTKPDGAAVLSADQMLSLIGDRAECVREAAKPLFKSFQLHWPDTARHVSIQLQGTRLDPRLANKKAARVVRAPGRRVVLQRPCH